MSTHKGHVKDENEFEVEVWVEYGPDGETPDHVFLMYRGSQMGDFPYGQPGDGDRVQEAADRIASGISTYEEIDPYAVIDHSDTEVTWH